MQNKIQVLINSTPEELPIPRIETRIFNSIDENGHKVVFSFFGIVYDHLAEGRKFIFVDSSKASSCGSNLDDLHVGWRREADLLNLCFELKLRGFVFDEKNNYKEIILNKDNCPIGLKNKANL